MRVTRKEFRGALIEKGKQLLRERNEACDEMKLSADYRQGLEEGIAEMIAALLKESATDIAEEIQWV